MKRAMVVGWCLCSLFFANGPVASETRYQKAVTALSAGNFELGVKEYYAAFVLEDPLLSPICRQQDLKSAEGFFKLKFEQTTKKDKPAFYLSLVRRLQGDLLSGHQLVDELRARHPGSKILTFTKGEFLLASEQFKEASALFERLSSFPKSGPLVALAKHLQQKAGCPPISESSRKHLLEEAYRHFDLAAYDEAERKINLFLQQFSRDGDGARCLLEILIAQERFSEAGKFMDRWKQQNGESPLPPLREANLVYFLGKFARARELLTPLVEASPENDHARVLLAECLFQEGSFAVAGQHFRHLVQTDSLNVGLLDRAVTCLEQTGELDEAIAFLTDALKRLGDQSLLRWKIALLYERQEKWTDAIEAYSRLIKEGNPFQAEAEIRLEIVQERQLESLVRRVRKPPSPNPGATPLASLQNATGSVPFGGKAPEKPVFQKKSQKVDLLQKLSQLYR